jgi:hypothetical protein
MKTICKKCNKERKVTRVMLYFINSGKSSGLCKSCVSLGNKKRLGSRCSKETIQRMSLTKIGVKKSLVHRQNIGKAKLGIKMPQISGNNHYLYIRDRTKLKISEKKHLDGQYRNWMFSVKNRDNWVCRIADVNCDGRLEAHHILNWIQYPELRYNVNNGITLCHAHHPRGRENEAKLSPYLQSLVAEMK